MNAVGARVYLHLPSRRRFVASVVASEWRTLAGRGANDIHVRTGWLGGPHLDLRAALGTACWDEVIASLAAGALQVPATPVTGASYRREADALGRVEGVSPPYPPLRPHGATEAILRPPGPVTPLERHREAGLALLLPALVATAGLDGDGPPLAAVAAALLCLAGTHPHGLRFGTFSFRSHAEAFLHWAGPGAGYRDAFSSRMAGKERRVLHELVSRALDGSLPSPAPLWHDAFISCQARFEGQVSEAELEAAGGAAPVMDPRRLGPERPQSSPFHQAVAASRVVAEPTPWFAAYRLTTNLFYQVLPALDVRPVQRFYLCHALAETVDDVTGETWQDRLAALENHLAAAR